MRKDSRGVVGLPMKLLVIMVILSVAIPVIAQSAADGERSMMGKEINRDVERILNASAAVYYSGADSSRTLEMSLPSGCEISIGGDGTDRYSLKSIYNGEVLSTNYFEKPPVEVDKRIVITGNCILAIKNVGDNTLEFSVT